VCYFFTFFHSRTACVLTELYSLSESFNLVHLSWICKYPVYSFNIEHLNVNRLKTDWISRDLPKHYSTICARTSACFGTSPLFLKSGKYHYMWFCIWRKNNQKMSSLHSNHSPHILPLSVLAWNSFENTLARTFAKVSFTIKWLLQQCITIWWHFCSWICIDTRNRRYQAPCNCGADKKIHFSLLTMWISPHNMTSLALYYFTNWIKSLTQRKGLMFYCFFGVCV